MKIKAGIFAALAGVVWFGAAQDAQAQIRQEYSRINKKRITPSGTLTIAANVTLCLLSTGTATSSTTVAAPNCFPTSIQSLTGYLKVDPAQARAIGPQVSGNTLIYTYSILSPTPPAAAAMVQLATDGYGWCGAGITLTRGVRTLLQAGQQRASVNFKVNRIPGQGCVAAP